MEIWGAAMLFILAFLGFVLVVFLIFFLWLAHEYNIEFSITSKNDGQEEPKSDSVLFTGGVSLDESSYEEDITDNDTGS